MRSTIGSSPHLSVLDSSRDRGGDVLRDGVVTLSDWRDNPALNKSDNPYYRHRFPPEVISHAVWLYHRFTLSFRDIEEILAIRGNQTSYESIRRWCLKFPQKSTKSRNYSPGSA